MCFGISFPIPTDEDERYVLYYFLFSRGYKRNIKTFSHKQIYTNYMICSIKKDEKFILKKSLKVRFDHKNDSENIRKILFAFDQHYLTMLRQKNG